jgi:hypothetical protein
VELLAVHLCLIQVVLGWNHRISRAFQILHMALRIEVNQMKSLDFTQKLFACMEEGYIQAKDKKARNCFLIGFFFCPRWCSSDFV